MVKTRLFSLMTEDQIKARGFEKDGSDWKKKVANDDGVEFSVEIIGSTRLGYCIQGQVVISVETPGDEEGSVGIGEIDEIAELIFQRAIGLKAKAQMEKLIGEQLKELRQAESETDTAWKRNFFSKRIKEYEKWMGEMR